MKIIQLILTLAIYLYIYAAARDELEDFIENIYDIFGLDFWEPWIGILVVGILIGVISLVFYPLLIILTVFFLMYNWRKNKDNTIEFFDNLFNT